MRQNKPTDQNPARVFMSRREWKCWLKQAIPSFLFSTAFILLFHLSTKDGKVLGPNKNAPGYYSVIALSILIPIFYCELYRIVTRRPYVGTVENCFDREMRKLTEKQTLLSNPISMMNDLKKRDGRVVLVRDDYSGKIRKYAIKGRNDAEYARRTFFVGDRVEFWFGAKYPIPQGRELGNRFCYCCGVCSEDEHASCPECGCPYPGQIYKQTNNTDDIERN